MRKFRKITIGKLEIDILFFILLIAGWFGKYLDVFLISWGLAFMHEITHILIGMLLKIEVSGISVMPFGLCAKLKNPVIKSPVKEIIMASSGPLMSLLLAVVSNKLYMNFDLEILRFISIMNMGLCVINLLPCLPLDGGRILKASITLFSDALTALKITIRISRIVSFLVVVVAVALLLTSSFNFSFLLIGSFLVGNLCFEQRFISEEALREVMYHKEKLDKNQLSKASVLTAYEDIPARYFLHNLSYHNYHLIVVQDKNNRVTKTLTEGQILDALLNGSIRITLKDI